MTRQSKLGRELMAAERLPTWYSHGMPWNTPISFQAFGDLNHLNIANPSIFDGYGVKYAQDFLNILRLPRNIERNRKGLSKDFALEETAQVLWSSG